MKLQLVSWDPSVVYGAQEGFQAVVQFPFLRGGVTNTLRVTAEGV